MSSFADLPKWDELEDKKRYWPAKPGSRDEGLGMLRYLTPAHVARVVKQEVRTGQRVCLNWEMTRLETPGFNRFPCEHQIVPIPNYEGIAWDDIWRFNPQASSQWDGFRHYSADMGDGTRKWYGGTTSDEISQGKSDRIGVGHWAQQGIAARGVFIDYVSYAEKRGLETNGMVGHAITLEQVKEIAEECNITFQHGDIFFLRCGFTKTWESLTLEQKQDYRVQTQAHKHRHSGLIQSEAVARFMWENHVVAVAGDGVSFEVRPNRDNEWSMHNYCLAGWGVPIGEMFDLERLADLCKDLKRWTFFVTSSPLNHPRAVASPPNIMAIF
ncbi:hypothetical protein LTR47_005722 [Exophiala xenobiotica]|nr:hypothetical protein LTR92_009686 [Exophiala xenobiotica]KAK5204989.1 hypothetical protein LTR41_009199 [Exophiala xenobiotica]KAK5233225.1 hypothetical protein LTR47_005722 [Exophiala xenobiotica]KAK5250806.1 hypothetical protein LTS06_004514 [Exophiala xenobiotica]KAK5259816.1 hypothetical protein LTR40_005279 [Exophiala xenobiotica]